ncbi:DUF4041 domain-containing protein [Pantanalinema rosaneae CENA516]|uniref:DUF4041 domain-containing protein n=1 Tax=Pantanalinema rosaneae TaxID=1620701 RepID=UPI003D6E1137
MIWFASMTFLLLLVSIGLATALALTFKQLQQYKNDCTIAQQRVKEVDRRLQAADRKYSGLISREDAIRELDTQITVLTARHKQFIQQAEHEEHKISDRISILKNQLKELEEQELVEAFGFYESKYDFQGSDDYKQRLDQIRAQQKQMLKDKQAAICHAEWTVGGSAKEGKKMTNNFLKLVLRAFNGESDASVMKVKYNNVQTMENRIRKTYEELNKLSQTTHCEISASYLNLKLQELWLTHEYQEKKYEEQEEQRIIREQMREEEKAIRELEKARLEAEREEARYQEALEKARKDIESATGKTQQKLLSQIEELEKRLAEAEANKQRAISQAQMTKSGHVYIISNIGSFGDDVYKIGMTRRENPLDRVKELGDASVPFSFDVHAMISCENAPELEARLHKRFDNRRMNKMNARKEFFRVSLQEIIQAVQEIDKELKICKSEVKFTKVAEAADYRKTLAKERELEQQRVTVAS